MPTKVKKLRRNLKREVKEMNNQMKQLQTVVHLADCEQEKCNQFQGEIFVVGHRSGKMSAFHPNNPTKQNQWFEFKTSFCKDCGLERGKPKKVPN